MIAPLPFRGRLGFALGFCRRDLLEAAARPVTLAVIAAVTLATAAACLALALPWITAEIRLRRLAETPWARCIWVSVHPLEEKFTDARLSRLQAAVQEAITAADPGVTVAGFHDVFDLEFFERQGKGSLHCNGRTINRSDPLLPALGKLLQWGDGFDGPVGPGVILSPLLLERLGWSVKQPPSAIRVRLPLSGRTCTWTVVGVTRDPLPLGHDFLLTEAEDERLRGIDLGSPVNQVWSGPLGPDWPKQWSDFPQSLQKQAAQKWQIESEVSRRLKGLTLKLTAADARPEEAWRGYLVQIQQRMVEQGYAEAPGFDAVESDGQTDRQQPRPRGPYSKATIYVANLKHLRAAADAARSLDLYANDAARALVDEIEWTSDQAKLVLLGLVLAFCAAGFITLVLALYLRGQQKIAQFGMLRAMGADNRLLQTIAVTEAGGMWLGGTLVGLVLAVGIGAVLAWCCGVTAGEVAAGLQTGWWAASVGGFLLLSLACCVLGNLWATRQVRHRPAAESLGLTS